MPPVIITQEGLIALSYAIKAVFDYQALRLQKVQGAAELDAEMLKPWLALARHINAALGVKEDA